MVTATLFVSRIPVCLPRPSPPNPLHLTSYVWHRFNFLSVFFFAQTSKLSCTLRSRNPRYLLTCWSCYHEKKLGTRCELAWQIELNLIYFPQTEDDSIGIYCCFDCHKWFHHHLKRTGQPTFCYNYTRGDYIKDKKATWAITQERTKAFVIRNRAYERRQEEKKQMSEETAAQPSKRPRPNDQVGGGQPATKAPTATAPTPQTAPTASAAASAVASTPPAAKTASGIPKPTDRSSYAKNMLFNLSDGLANVRKYVVDIIKTYPGTPPVIKDCAADHILEELDKADVCIFALSKHVQWLLVCVVGPSLWDIT